MEAFKLSVSEFRSSAFCARLGLRVSCHGTDSAFTHFPPHVAPA